MDPQEQDLVARTMLSEAGDQGDEGLAAVAHVIRNRALGSDPDFPRDVTGVIHQRNAFSAWNNPRGKNNPNDFRSNDPQLIHARDIAAQVFSGNSSDPTNGATYYADVPLSKKLYGKIPAFSKYPQTAQIGNHTFYNPNPAALPAMASADTGADLASEWAQPESAKSQATSPDLAAEWTQPATFAERFAGESQPPPEGGGFVQGLAHGAVSSVANMLSAGGQAAQAEMSQPIDVPNQQQTFDILQKNITGQLTPGTGFAGRLGENIGGAAPYIAAMPSPGGPIAQLARTALQSGLVGGGQTLGESATKGTALEPYGGAIGGLAAPTTLPYLTSKFMGGVGAAASGILGRSTGVGDVPIEKAFASGAVGGSASEAFKAGLTGQVTPKDLVDQARGALSKMYAARGAQYRSSMEGVKENANPISFDAIDSAMDKINETKVFRGQSGTALPINIGEKTDPVRDEINSKINTWKALDPAEYHTPIGIDALKQSIGEIKDSLPIGTPQWKVASDSYNAIRGAIVKNAPEYAKVMKDYESASDQLDEIRKTMSLGANATDDTAFRKFMSIMRNNVNTNYGRRSDLVNTLEQYGAPNLSHALAGQALSAPFARGLTGNLIGGLAIPAAIEAYAQGGMRGVAALTAALPFQSPNLVGRAAHGLGRVYGKTAPSLQGTPIPARALFNLGDQSQKLPNANIRALTAQ